MLDLRPKSICAVEMTMYVHGTLIRNRKELRIRVYNTVLNKMKPQLCFFLKKPSLVLLNRTNLIDLNNHAH